MGFPASTLHSCRHSSGQAMRPPCQIIGWRRNHYSVSWSMVNAPRVVKRSVSKTRSKLHRRPLVSTTPRGSRTLRSEMNGELRSTKVQSPVKEPEREKLKTAGRQGKPELQAPLKLPAFHARTVQDWQAIYAPTHHNLKPLRWLDSLRQRWTNSTMCLCIILTIYTCMVICTAHCRLMHAMYAQTPVMRADHVSSSLTAAVPEASSWDNMSPSSSLKPAISSLDWIHYTLTIDITDLGLYQQLYLCQCRYVTMKT